ncbi:MAG TPA: SGNH/GDSL hydrolase family protein, partial [Candidatus Hydrogenedentes bacterium]|nr:SGNH/GDSL hydrolase family protein [Candidatus Hydrogenedentota bacterium]
MSSLSVGKTIVYSLLPLVLLAVLLESLFRVVEIWRPPLPVDYGWGFDANSRLFVPDAKSPDTMITAPQKRVSFQDQ